MIVLKVLAVFWGFIILGCLISDDVFPRIGPIERMIDSLPLMRDEPAEGGRKETK